MTVAQEVIRDWIAAANLRDPERLAQLYAPEAHVLYSWGELFTGQKQIERHFANFFAAFPNWAKEPQSFVDGLKDWSVLEWQASAAFLGPYDHIEPTGRSFRLRGCGVFHIVDRRIRVHRRYLDRLDWYQQLGVV
jgi:hypothetical protein